MAGGLLQLIAYGTQDQFLTGNPGITFFKSVYRHHTNFAMESILQTPNGRIDNGNKISYTIARNGDLITDCWLELKNCIIGDKFATNIIKSVELEIGGQKIDKHTGEWLQIWLSYINDARNSIVMRESMLKSRQITNKRIPNLYIPLQFFFCRNPGLALPLIGLQYHEVKIHIEFESENNSFDISRPAIRETEGGGPGRTGLDSIELYVNYIYLDVDERRRFAQTSHQMLIEQLQYSYDNFSESIRLDLNHPVKEIIWKIGDYQFNDQDYHDVLTDFVRQDDDFESAKLMLNNQDRFSERTPEYFRCVQPYQHHKCIPLVNGLYSYSFALKPEEHQPSGTCNFSRIDSAYLIFKNIIRDPQKTIKIFATNYNILRITSGMAGLAFSN